MPYATNLPHRPRTALTLTVLAGPWLSVSAASALTWAGGLSALPAAVVVAVVLLFWSPLPFSVPAVLMDHDRDLCLPAQSRAFRAAALIPWMLTSPHSTARVPMAASLVGFAVACLQVQHTL